MLLVLDLLSTLFFAFFGATIALRLRMNFFAIFLSAMLPATGGGTVREFLLGSDTVFWIATPNYLLAVFAAITIAVLIDKIRRLPECVCRMLDSLGTCVFIMVGVIAAVESGCNPFTVFLFGVLTGIGGGILRDLLFDRRAVLRNKFKIVLAISMALLCSILIQQGSEVVSTILLLSFLHFVNNEIHCRKSYTPMVKI